MGEMIILGPYVPDDHSTMKVTYNPESRFYAEAAVGIAKSAVFQAHAEEELTRGEAMLAAMACYYSLFHRGLAQMFLAPSRVETKLAKRMDENRVRGERLPNSSISHRDVREFLRQWPSRFALFMKAMGLREFANYGPRVGWKEDPPVAVLIGPAGFSTSDLKGLVSDSAGTFTSDLFTALAHVSPDLNIRLVVIDTATELLCRRDLNLSEWCSAHICHRASELVEQLRRHIVSVSEPE